MYKLKHIKAQSNMQYYSRLGVTLNAVTITDGFFLYIAKESTEYTNVQFMLGPNEHIFSDVFEVIAWGSKPAKIALDIKVEGRPRCNEEVLLFPIEGDVDIDIISQIDENIIDEIIEVYIYFCSTYGTLSVIHIWPSGRIRLKSSLRIIYGPHIVG